MSADDLVNKGFIRNQSSAQSGRTFIVTGLQRSGTSLVAAVLQQSGLFMGSTINDAVFEDEEIAAVLEAGDIETLRHIIGARNAGHARWGFKYPMLYQVLNARQLELFDRPRLIATFRDPVAMAVRTSLSEYRQPMTALRDLVSDQVALAAFLSEIEAPTLLLSYEKALAFPEDFVDVIMQFCEISPAQQMRSELLGLIAPNSRRYIATARRRYDGLIEGVRDGQLYGWCHLSRSSDPVMLDVLVDERVALSLAADVFRQDLLQAGIGNGSHGYFVAVEMLRARPESVIRVRVTHQDIDLRNSGKRLCDFGTSA